MQHPQPRDTYGLHGFAILAVENPPLELRALLPSPLAPPALGDAVLAVGYPAPIGELTVTDTTVGAMRGGDLVLSYQTGSGYSGAPVVRNGLVAGLVFGVEGRFGLAAQTQEHSELLGGLWRSMGREECGTADGESGAEGGGFEAER